MAEFFQIVNRVPELLTVQTVMSAPLPQKQSILAQCLVSQTMSPNCCVFGE